MLPRHSLKWLAISLHSTSLAASLPRRDVSDQEDICAIHGTRVAVAADILYFMGGKYTFRRGDTDSTQPRLYSIPLNNSFPVDGPLPANNYYQVPAPQQWRGQGAFFQDADETMLYSFAGYGNDKDRPVNTLNTYNVTSGEWSNISVSGGDFNYYARGDTSRAISRGSSEALGFVTGGWNDVGGMVRFDASKPANPTWQNETDNSPPLTLEGGMEYIRLGPKGSLINFGGYNKDYINPNLTGWSFDRRPLSQINVYDIDSATWYNVTASGDIPSDRSSFCTAVSSAPDDSSFQITMYAGWDLFGGRSFGETYVLSIPSFQWINVTGSSNLDASLSESSEKSGRDHHQCVAHKDRKMLVLGGILRIDSDEQNLRGCDDDLPAIRALDLTTFKFTDQWDGSPEPYSVPDAVTRIIGGNGQGGATMKQPDGGFNDSALNTIFGQVAPRYTPPIAAISHPRAGSGSGSGDSSPAASSSGSNTGAIAGGVIGGLAGLALIATSIFFLLRRRRQRSAAAHPSHTSMPPPVGLGDQKPLEMSDGHQDPQIATGEYYKPPHVVGGYEPLRQEMDSGYRGSEIVGEGDHDDGRGTGRRPVGELPG